MLGEEDLCGHEDKPSQKERQDQLQSEIATIESIKEHMRLLTGSFIDAEVEGKDGLVRKLKSLINLLSIRIQL